MARPIEFFFDFVSPTTYLAWTQLPGLRARSGSVIHCRPFLLGAVMQAIGNTSPVAVPAKRANLFRDIERFAEHYGVSFVANRAFPFNTLPLLRGAVSYQLDGDFEGYLSLVFRALWAEGLNLADEAVLREVLGRGGFDAEDFAVRIQRPEVKQALVANTEEAVQRGAFGAPTFFVGGEMFFGQDRLPMVEKYATKA